MLYIYEYDYNDRMVSNRFNCATVFTVRAKFKKKNVLLYAVHNINRYDFDEW